MSAPELGHQAAKYLMIKSYDYGFAGKFPSGRLEYKLYLIPAQSYLLLRNYKMTLSNVKAQMPA